MRFEMRCVLINVPTLHSILRLGRAIGWNKFKNALSVIIVSAPVKPSKSRTMLQRLARIVNCCFLAYLIGYVILTLSGTYSDHLVASGQLVYNFGLSARDSVQWVPLGIVRERAKCNLLGVIYMPFVDLDRKYWHKSIIVVSPN